MLVLFGLLATPSIVPAQPTQGRVAPHCPAHRPTEGASCGHEPMRCAWSCGEEDSYDWTCECARGGQWRCTRGLLCGE